MKKLVTTIRQLLEHGPMDAEGLSLVKEKLGEAFKNGSFACLCSRDFEPGRYLCYQDPQFGFVVMMMVWGEGQGTPIHDHGTWAAELVIKNKVKVTEYSPEGADKDELPVIRAGVYGEGDTMSLLPPSDDVHKVEHHSGKQAITIHVYGRSMDCNHVFVPGRGFVENELRTCELGTLSRDVHMALTGS